MSFHLKYNIYIKVVNTIKLENQKKREKFDISKSSRAFYVFEKMRYKSAGVRSKKVKLRTGRDKRICQSTNSTKCAKWNC